MAIKPRKKYWWRIETYICPECRLVTRLKIKLTKPIYEGKVSYEADVDKCLQCRRQAVFTAWESSAL